MNNLIQRSFIVGDNWLYYKVYAGNRTSDMILLKIIKPLTQSLCDKGIVDKWFFIRYADPKPHLRIRFHCPESENIGVVISELLPFFKELINQDLVWRIQIDTYNRELERYGENTILISETIFFYDSILIICLLENINQDEELRWQFSLKIIDNMLNNFKFSIDEKVIFMELLKTGFAKEFGSNKGLNKQIDSKYRKFKHTIQEILSDDISEPNEYSEINNLFVDFNINISSHIDILLDLNKSNLLMININSLLSSYIHMSMVRLFKSNNRMHEMIVYDFLYRYYKSLKARSINN